jgi:UDP-glucose 4-epimerase
MNILVIGGNGFIGSHLVDHLLVNGHHVRVFDLSFEKFRKPLTNVDYRISSLDNIPDLYEALLGIDIVFHLASSSVPSTSNIDLVADVNKNLICTLNILNLAVKLRIKRFVYFSSGGAVYGNPIILPIPENHILNPISSYGILKMTIEHYLNLYEKNYDFNTIIIRPSNPYGPRQGHFIAQGVISTFLKKIKQGEPLTIFGDGKSVKDYIYIDDLIHAAYKLGISQLTGIFNLGSGEGTDLNSIIEIIKEKTGTKPKINFNNSPNYDVNRFVLDITKVKSHIDWTPQVPMEEGIEKLWNWFKSQE